jgi:D-alanyl-D-alanine dipeptidase
MPVADSGEPLCDLEGWHERITLDRSDANVAVVGYPPIFMLRRAVAIRLGQAAERLPSHLRLKIKDAFRPMSRQSFSYDRHLVSISRAHPGIGADEAAAIASRYVAPPSTAGHPTGAAFDATLCDLDGADLDMGCAYDANERESHGACFSFCEIPDAAAMANRRRLFEILGAAGFVNYPFEWWHWSYGDKYWAAGSGAPHALYGPVTVGAPR